MTLLTLSDFFNCLIATSIKNRRNNLTNTAVVQLGQLVYLWFPRIDCVGILKLRNADIELRNGETDVGRKNTRVRLVFRVHIPQPGGQLVSLQVASDPIECCKKCSTGDETIICCSTIWSGDRSTCLDFWIVILKNMKKAKKKSTVKFCCSYHLVLFHVVALMCPQPNVQLKNCLQWRGRIWTSAQCWAVNKWFSPDRILHLTPKWFSLRRHKVTHF